MTPTTSTRTLDLFTAPLQGAGLIEASAGTGKTYTITGLYLRLILQAERRVDQILVVTFTNAATEELKARIRRRLVQTQRAFSEGKSDDPLCRRFLQCIVDERARELALRRLNNAIRGFDEAAIYTIHGFCQRVLIDKAFASGMPFETELRADTGELQREISEDFWRKTFYRASPLLVRYLLEKNYTPDRLLSEIRPYLGKPYLKVLTVEDAEEASVIENTFVQAYAAAKQAWRRQRETVANLLLETNALNRNKYRKASIPVWVALMDDYLDSKEANIELFERFEKFTVRGIAEALKKSQDATALEHEFFVLGEQLLRSHEALQQLFATRLKALRAELIGYCNHELIVRKQHDQVQSYDDLLSNLRNALRSELGDALAAGIRKRYSAALIDEFQDTDPVQYEIFRRIYGGSDLPLFFVGDPKQAIYSFRGADVFAYLEARGDSSHTHTLAANWRSDPQLIGAVNTLFMNARQPFLIANIPFYEVRPAHTARQRLTINGVSSGQNPEKQNAAAAPLQIWFLAGEEEKKALGKSEAGESIARATAIEIAELLNLGKAGEAEIGEKPLSGGDVAVLVRTHRQGTLIRQALLKLGVPSVQHAQDNVFHSREAEELEWILAAVAEPGREARVRAALASELLGFSGEDIYRLRNDEKNWETQLQRFHDFHELWHQRGFIRFFRSLMRECHIAQHLLAFHDGERRLTNLTHLAELLSAAAASQRLGPESLLKWLAERRRSQAAEDDQYQLRLESDAHLVQIVTVHKSKGLEYGVVFCPFLWDGRLRSERADILSFHDPEAAYQAVLDLGSPEQEMRRVYAKNEELAENLRLLYVALTRAQYRCYLVWGNINEAGSSALAWLLHQPALVDPDSDLVSATSERYRAMTASALYRELQALVTKADGAIALSPLPSVPAIRYQPTATATSRFEARSFRGPVRGAWRISSFTALTSQHGAELPDYDASAWTGPSASAADTPSFFTFPRGARAGRCLHQIFEYWDFTCKDHSALQALVEKALTEHGFELSWTDIVAAAVSRILQTPLSRACPPLLALPRQKRLDELEFYYPLAALNPDSLKRLLNTYSVSLKSFREDIETLTFSQTKGYMKGYIDLVFEAEDKFYIVDYKSNWLGNDIASYQPRLLADAMARDSYYLQYLIYTIALHRYLQLRLPGYAYEQHFGGVFYLFLRGIDPAYPGNGIFSDVPEKALVEQLDRYLATGYAD